MTCQVCGAPALPLGGACVFCHTPLADGSEPPGLLDYLAGCLPGVQLKRGGVRRRGPIQELAVEVGGEVFRARLVKGRLALLPEMETGPWIDRLLAKVSSQAATDGELRSAVSRAGWAYR